jgi:tetratricopeptide (TPR) repeat protein
VFLDNFEDVIDHVTHNLTDAELDEALRALVKLPHHGVKLILTTRVAPRSLSLVHPGRQMRLDLDGGLESPYAENILREMDADGKLGLKSAPDQRLALARERTRGFPRALEALFAIVSADRDTTLEEVLAGTSTLLPENVTEALVGEAFSRLDPTQQRVMQALAVYGRPVPPTGVDYLLQPHQPDVDSTPVLSRLVNMHFARKEAGRYYLHPVDREYALSRLAQGEVSDRRTRGPTFTLYGLRHRAATFFQHARLPHTKWKTIENVAPQLAEFELRCEGEDYETAADVLSEISSDYLMLWGWNRRVIELNERLLGKLDDPRLRSIILRNQGRAYLDLGQAMAAIGYLEQAVAITREVGDRRGEGIDLGNLGHCYWTLGNTTRAIDHYEQYLAVAREVGFRNGEGVALRALGACYSDLGHTARAVEYHEKGLTISREVGSRREEGIALDSLGSCYGDLGQIDRAVEYHEQALAIDREVGDRRGEGIDLCHLSICYGALGQAERAIEYNEGALVISREVGDRLGEGYDLCHLALLSVDGGRHRDATQQAIEAVRLGGDAGDPKVISSGNENLALARLCVGDLHGARAAVEAARDHDVPTNNHNVLALLGLIALRQGDRVAATEAFQAAISHADVILERYDRNFRALDSRGLALAGMAVLAGGRCTVEAIVTFHAARSITSAPGIVSRVKRLLNAMAPADAAGILAPVYKAAEGAGDAVEA